MREHWLMFTIVCLYVIAEILPKGESPIARLDPHTIPGHYYWWEIYLGGAKFSLMLGCLFLFVGIFLYYLYLKD